MTVDELNRSLVSTLTPILGQREALAAARIIWEDVMHYTPVEIVTRGSHRLEDFTVKRINDIVRHVAGGEPVQYATGLARFMGMDFKVTPATLIPRPETAGLVDMICDHAGDRPDLRVLDIGTGSGCIAIALSRALHFAHVDAIDISSDAVAVARENAAQLKAAVNFSIADALQLKAPATPCYDIIVSNPPYVLESERADMDARVVDHEPPAALFVPDSDPLRYYTAIAGYAAKALVPGGQVYFEINPLEARAMKSMLKAKGYDNVAVSRDYLGRERYASAVKP